MMNTNLKILRSEILDEFQVQAKDRARIRGLFNEKGNLEVQKLINGLLRYDDQGRCVNAFTVLSNERMLKLAYELGKSNPGNMVKGTDEETLDGINQE